MAHNFKLPLLQLLFLPLLFHLCNLSRLEKASWQARLGEWELLLLCSEHRGLMCTGEWIYPCCSLPRGRVVQLVQRTTLIANMWLAVWASLCKTNVVNSQPAVTSEGQNGECHWISWVGCCGRKWVLLAFYRNSVWQIICWLRFYHYRPGPVSLAWIWSGLFKTQWWVQALTCVMFRLWSRKSPSCMFSFSHSDSTKAYTEPRIFIDQPS